jgi:hypothetical protein
MFCNGFLIITHISHLLWEIYCRKRNQQSCIFMYRKLWKYQQRIKKGTHYLSKVTWFEDTEGVISSRKSKKDGKYIGRKKRKTNTDLLNTTEKNKRYTNQLINGLIVAYDTMRGRRGRDRISVAFTTFCAINAYYD